MPYSNIQWSQETYNLFLNDLKDLADPKYKAFHERLCKTARAEILGVRTPDTKRIAKDIVKGDADTFLKFCGDTYYEELLIKGFVLGFQKKPLSKKRKNLDAFVLQIDNWAVCDGFCAALKPKQTEYACLYDWCCALLQTDGEYTRRTAIVLLMDYLLCDAYIDRVLGGDFQFLVKQQVFGCGDFQQIENQSSVKSANRGVCVRDFLKIQQ